MDEVEFYSRKIVEAMRMLYLKGLLTGLGGNFSVRLSNGLVLMTPSSSRPIFKMKYELEPEDLVVVDLGGRVVRGSANPTSELPMHLAIYRACERCRAVAHVHGTYSPLMDEGLADKLVMDTELELVFRPRICFVGKFMPGSEELARAVSEKAREGCNIIYMKGHGVVAVHENLTMALEFAELAELLAERTIVARPLLEGLLRAGAGQ
ncbi:MAG: class II aldolase/adducin family protein [Desulfurococcaceae archaeon]